MRPLALAAATTLLLAACSGEAGPQGPAGPGGPTGAAGVQGVPGLIWKGGWDAGTAYAARRALVSR